MGKYKVVSFPFRDMVGLYRFGLSKKLNLNSAVSSETIFGERKNIPFAAALQLLIWAKYDKPLKLFNFDHIFQNDMAEKIKYHHDHFNDLKPEMVTLYDMTDIGDESAGLDIVNKNEGIIKEVVLFTHFVKSLTESKNYLYHSREEIDQDFNKRLHRFLASVRGLDSINLSLSKQAIRPESKKITINSNFPTLTQLPSGFLQVVFLLGSNYGGYTLSEIDQRISDYCKKSELTRAERGRMIKEFRDNFDKRIIMRINKQYESGPLFVQIAENIITGEKRYVLNPLLNFDGVHYLSTTTESQLTRFRETFQDRNIKLTSNFISLYLWIISTLHTNRFENIALKTESLNKVIGYLPLTGKHKIQNLKTLNEHLEIIKFCCPELGIEFAAANSKLVGIDLSENSVTFRGGVKSDN